ncbi:hypothetical protein HOK51_02085 [Candidatus Woesearchaeota archaeon]|jgi:hypothetical protein|nr:hypothetical protein [Candidatus Woesearchaeota archaeon]MBT6518605.1 hypothetical protein [Candidatus Woesearchaeota archaeon]MBT7368755.1 hypothetical protein [Candidatus Woesearchaeota archaeon]
MDAYCKYNGVLKKTIGIIDNYYENNKQLESRVKELEKKLDRNNVALTSDQDHANPTKVHLSTKLFLISAVVVVLSAGGYVAHSAYNEFLESQASEKTLTEESINFNSTEYSTWFSQIKNILEPTNLQDESSSKNKTKITPTYTSDRPLPVLVKPPAKPLAVLEQENNTKPLNVSEKENHSHKNKSTNNYPKKFDKSVIKQKQSKTKKIVTYSSNEKHIESLIGRFFKDVENRNFKATSDYFSCVRKRGADYNFPERLVKRFDNEDELYFYKRAIVRNVDEEHNRNPYVSGKIYNAKLKVQLTSSNDSYYHESLGWIFANCKNQQEKPKEGDCKLLVYKSYLTNCPEFTF